MFLSSRLSFDPWHWFPVGGVVAEHGPEDVESASGEGEHGLDVGFAFTAFSVVIAARGGTAFQG